jgi:predicted transcriptional regulator
MEAPVKTTTIPPLRVSPTLRRQVEAVLTEGETLSSFMLEALQKSVAQRRDQQAFVARGMASAESARRSGSYVGSELVLRRLSAKQAATKKRSAG